MIQLYDLFYLYIWYFVEAVIYIYIYFLIEYLYLISIFILISYKPYKLILFCANHWPNTKRPCLQVKPFMHVFELLQQWLVLTPQNVDSEQHQNSFRTHESTLVIVMQSWAGMSFTCILSMGWTVIEAKDPWLSTVSIGATTDFGHADSW